MEETFGTPISVYTRKQAIEDGVLVDVSEMAREAGFRDPTAITQAVHGACEVPKGNRIQSYEGRLWDVLHMAAMAARRGRGTRVPFVVRIGNKNHHLLADRGPGDNAEPVITIGYSSDF
jgi:hypothetical protein